MDGYPVEISIDLDDRTLIHARSGYVVGTGRSVEEALTDLKRHLGPEALKARLDKMGWYENNSSLPAAGREPDPPSDTSSPSSPGADKPRS